MLFTILLQSISSRASGLAVTWSTPGLCKSLGWALNNRLPKKRSAKGKNKNKQNKTTTIKKGTKATLLGKKGFTTSAKLELLTWQLSLGKVLAALRRRKYLHSLVTGCRWWYSGDYKQIVGILQFYCCVIARRCRYMTAYLSPAGAQESGTTPEGSSSSSTARMELWSSPPTLLGITPGYGTRRARILLLNEDVWISCTGKERLILQLGIK